MLLSELGEHGGHADGPEQVRAATRVGETARLHTDLGPRRHKTTPSQDVASVTLRRQARAVRVETTYGSVWCDDQERE